MLPGGASGRRRSRSRLSLVAGLCVVLLFLAFVYTLYMAWSGPAYQKAVFRTARSDVVNTQTRSDASSDDHALSARQPPPSPSPPQSRTLTPQRDDPHTTRSTLVPAKEEPANAPAPPFRVGVDDLCHIFYYPWYGNDDHGQYKHWNHEVLSHWTASTNRQYPSIGKYHTPPHDIGANFYPLLGPYDSASRSTIRTHFRWIRQTGCAVVVSSWWGRGQGQDRQGAVTNNLTPALLQAAYDEGVRIALHVEPYEGRDAASFAQDVRYFIDHYGEHPGLYRNKDGLPVYYVYDSYHTPGKDWARVLSPEGPLSIRNTKYDGEFITLVVEANHFSLAKEGRFDGVYTYFASTGFSFGSSLRNWARFVKFGKEHGKTVSLSVGPGYIDTRIRPWNARNTKDREDGGYYDRMWGKAVDLSRDNPRANIVVSVTSFNEWHEGTQIEPSAPKRDYLDFSVGSEHPPYWSEASRKVFVEYQEGDFTGTDVSANTDVPPSEWANRKEFQYLEATRKWVNVLKGEGT